VNNHESAIDDQSPSVYQVQVENFSGPFDLLLHLIEQEEVDIYQVSISRITDNYLSYLHQMRANKLDIGSEFLILATTLLALKSRLLLPQETMEQDHSDDEIDRISLLDRLVEYKHFREMSDGLALQAEYSRNIFTRDAAIQQSLKDQHITPRWEVSGADLNKLLKAFEDLWKRRLLEDIEEREIREDTITVRDKMSLILDKLGTQRFLTFSQLFSEPVSRVDIIVTFLAVLEITRRQLAVLLQDHHYEDIKIERAWGAVAPLNINEHGQRNSAHV